MPVSCPGDWFGRHKFEPRYDTKIPQTLLETGFEGTVSTIEKVKDKIYVRDICVHCGAKIERAKP
jgi:hypothetical protein